MSSSFFSKSCFLPMLVVKPRPPQTARLTFEQPLLHLQGDSARRCSSNASSQQAADDELTRLKQDIPLAEADDVIPHRGKETKSKQEPPVSRYPHYDILISHNFKALFFWYL
jgi:hypothetical protein